MAKERFIVFILLLRFVIQVYHSNAALSTPFLKKTDKFYKNQKIEILRVVIKSASLIIRGIVATLSRVVVPTHCAE